MKLVFFIHSLTCGGAERVCVGLANHWVLKKWDVTIVTVSSRSFDFYDIHPAVKRVSLELSGDSSHFMDGLWKNMSRVYQLRKLLKKLRPDVALAMMNTSNVVLALAAWGLPKIKVIGSERVYPPAIPLGYIWEVLRRYTYGLMDAVTVQTRKGGEWITKHTNARRVSVISNPVSLSLSVGSVSTNPNMFCRPMRKILIAVGRLDLQKGFDRLIEAFSPLALKHFDWDLVILGEGVLYAELEKQIKKLALKERVFLPGRVGNVHEWYKQADLYVMSSHFEGFPNTLVEAMSYGLPVVSFDCETGPRDIIREEVDGLLVPQDNVVELSAALDRLMSDSALRQRFAVRAKEVHERFSMKHIVGMWETLFEAVLHE